MFQSTIIKNKPIQVVLKMFKISQRQLAQIVSQTNGEFFYCKFIKRTNGEVREIVCRTDVHKYEKGVGLNYDPSAKNLLSVWESNTSRQGAERYRMINLDAILEISYKGQKYQAI